MLVSPNDDFWMLPLFHPNLYPPENHIVEHNMFENDDNNSSSLSRSQEQTMGEA